MTSHLPKPSSLAEWRLSLNGDLHLTPEGAILPRIIFASGFIFSQQSSIFTTFCLSFSDHSEWQKSALLKQTIKTNTVYITTTRFMYSTKSYAAAFSLSRLWTSIFGENGSKNSLSHHALFRRIPQKPAQTLPFSDLIMFY